MVQVVDSQQAVDSSTTHPTQQHVSQGHQRSAKTTKKSKGKGRFVKPSTSEEVDDLASARIAKVTVRQTRWAVKIFRGKLYFKGGGNCCNLSFERHHQPDHLVMLFGCPVYSSEAFCDNKLKDIVIDYYLGSIHYWTS